jgi:FemAB-related protein (PEP-CTERM system-associated)
LLKSFDAKLRSQVKRAAKEGAEVVHGHGELTAFYEVFRRHMRDLGTPVMPKRFFEDALATFPESTWICSVRHEGRAIAGAMGFRWRDEFEITWASSLTDYKRMSPNMLLYWGLMQRCIQDGVQRFNFGRTTPGSGPHRFKLQWGGREEPLHWYYPGDAEESSVPQKEQGRFALAARVWRRLPLAVATALGPRIVRGIP